MEGSNPINERKRLVEQVDKRVPSPEARARKVLAALQEKYGDTLDTWDIVCFSAEYLGMLSAAYTFLEEPARRLASLVYTAHYERFKNEPPAAEGKVPSGNQVV